MDVELNFINDSNDMNDSSVVIFQKNAAADEETAIAWTLIQNCGQGSNHPFTYPQASTIGYGDSYGNFTPQVDALPGQQFSAVFTVSGDEIQATGISNLPNQIELYNALPKGAIDARVFKSGRLFATKTGLAPGQTAVFEFKPTLWIGVVSEIVQGQAMNAAVVSSVYTEISLLGIASADIVMTGGGPGPSSTPFQFALQNIAVA